MRFLCACAVLLAACGGRRDASGAAMIAIQPPSAEVRAGGTLLFTAASGGPVAWSLAEGAAAGAIAPDGRYRAPGWAGTYHVIATGALGARASAEVVVSGPIAVAIAPAKAKLEAQAQLRFTASATGADSRVAWSIAEGPSGGSVDAAGLYVAPRTAGTYHLVASSLADPTRTAAAEIAVTPASVRISISPLLATLSPGAALRFAASVRGGRDARTAWSSDCTGLQPDGTFIAPRKEGTCRVVAQSVADPAQLAAAAVTIAKPTGIDPAAVTLLAGASVSLQGAGGFSVLEGAAGGSITAAGVYQAPPEAGGTFHVVAGGAVATITVVPPDLVDRGGPVAPSTRTFAVWWGDPASWPADVRTTQEQLLGGLDGSDYLALADQYLRGASATTRFYGSFYDISSPPDSPDKADAQAIGEEACNVLRAGGVTTAEGDLVFVYGGAGLTPAPSWCAWHSYYSCGGATLLVAFVPNVEGSWTCLELGAWGSCNAASNDANATASLTAHELMEAITNPLVGVWTDDAGQELGDKCEDKPRCVSLSTGEFLLQAEYSNADHACAP
jgi:hypothetical protein